MSCAIQGRLGILDWGIGGTAIYKLLKQRRPETPVIYLSDTGVTPYGRMERGELRDRLRTVIGELARRGVTHLVIGCNAASTALPELLQGGLPVEPILGVIDPAVRRVASLKPDRLGVIGGRRTILSGVYTRALAERGISVRGRVAQPLSARIEAGDTGSEELVKECRRILAPLRDRSHLLLACTHYPAIAPLLAACLPEGVELIDPADALVDELLAHSGLPQGDPEDPDLFLTTGDVEPMRRAARNAFDVEIRKAVGLDPGSLRERTSAVM